MRLPCECLLLSVVVVFSVDIGRETALLVEFYLIYFVLNIDRNVCLNYVLVVTSINVFELSGNTLPDVARLNNVSCGEKANCFPT